MKPEKWVRWAVKLPKSPIFPEFLAYCLPANLEYNRPNFGAMYDPKVFTTFRQ